MLSIPYELYISIAGIELSEVTIFCILCISDFLAHWLFWHWIFHMSRFRSSLMSEHRGYEQTYFQTFISSDLHYCCKQYTMVPFLVSSLISDPSHDGKLSSDLIILVLTRNNRLHGICCYIDYKLGKPVRETQTSIFSILVGWAFYKIIESKLWWKLFIFRR